MAPVYVQAMVRHKNDDPVPARNSVTGISVPVQHRVERAAGDLRRGMPVLVEPASAGHSVLAVSAETVRDSVLTTLRVASGGALRLILTHARARTLKIHLYTPEFVSVALEPGAGAEAVRAIADPSRDLESPLKGPFEATRDATPEGAGAAVKLAKLAGLLPAVVVVAVADEIRDRLANEGGVSRVAAGAISAFDAESAGTLELVARARIPLAGAEQTEFLAFRPRDGGQEHYALLIGTPASGEPVLTRLHSECFTGDLLGSLKCDCGDQLRGAIDVIAKAGGGVLLYLAQEGRGIGLMNKVRAYHLQDQGFDTIDANERIGFEADERLYDIAARMLHLLGYRRVRLLTNNPEKIRALEAAGIVVAERVAHSFPDNIHNRDYLRVKAERGGHLL